MLRLNTRIKIWLGINIFAMAFYLYAASAVWAPLGAKDFPALTGAAGDPILWALGPGLILAICTIINLFELKKIVSSGRATRVWFPLYLWIFVIFSWVGVNRYDVYNQCNGITFEIGHDSYEY